MPWSAEDVLDVENQRVVIPAHARTDHKGLLQERRGEDLCRYMCHAPSPMTQVVKELNRTEPNCTDVHRWMDNLCVMLGHDSPVLRMSTGLWINKKFVMPGQQYWLHMRECRKKI